ncbi:hypothetical protein B0H66DRAFT_608456 [Apodospora peruviana]|uniref:Uncharacterized protein n=1 Tax=Apodospora peruviana TaxID=516989 RepID=A0AAE0HSN7_9PEZI|nr:hypothetical protein B0H66DRAFT_608456 [Apodospora peruviana]
MATSESLSMDSNHPFIRQLLLGPDHRGIQNVEDLAVTLVINDNSLTYTFVDSLPKFANDDVLSFDTQQANVLLRIYRDGVPRDRDWEAIPTDGPSKPTPPMESLATWPAKYPLTYICRRLRKVGWTVNKPPQSAATVSFETEDYAPVEYQLPMLLFDLHWLLSQMLLDRGPKIKGDLGMADVVYQWAVWLANPHHGPPGRLVTDDFPEILVQDVHDCEKWMSEFRNELTALRDRVKEAQAMPADTSLVHYVEGYPNSTPRPGDFPIDHKERWDSASAFEQFFGTHKWHMRWPNWSAGERSYDYCWALWRVEEAVYLLEVLDDARFNALIDMWSFIYNSFQDITSTRTDIRETESNSDGPGKTEQIDDMMQRIRSTAKDILESIRDNNYTSFAICGPLRASPPQVVRVTTPDSSANWIENYYSLQKPIPSLQDLNPLTPAIRTALESAPGMTMVG